MLRATMLLAALAGLLAAPSAAAELLLPPQVCEGQVGACNWYHDGGSCAVVHAGTMWAGACTQQGETPVRFCTTVQTPLWRGWCPQDGDVVQENLGELLG